MKACRKGIISVALVLILTLMLALPVSAAKPQDSDLGILLIYNSNSDPNFHLAVCIAEEDGNYVYSGQHPIQQQVGQYRSITIDQSFNSVYDVEEDTEYDGIKGVYRFALKDKVQAGDAADVFLKTAAVKRNDTVYFVHLDMNENDVFVTEKTTVRSVQNGILTTKDKLEEEFGNAEFGVIFNDNGNVVGFCKSGVATVLVNEGSGGSLVIAGIVVACAVVLGLLLLLLRKKKAPVPPAPPVPGPGYMDDDRTTMDSDTMANDFVQPMNNALVLKCHGGYLNGRVYPIGANGLTIGRERDNSISYPPQTAGISRHHMKLFWQNGQLMLVDLGSSNGTYYNQAGRLSANYPVPVNPGDVFYLGEKLNGFEITYQ